MSLTFPTSCGATPPGRPDRAMHCRCGRGQLVDGYLGTCTRCGRYPLEVIAETWQRRARQIAASSRKRQARKAAA